MFESVALEHLYLFHGQMFSIQSKMEIVIQVITLCFPTNYPKTYKFSHNDSFTSGNCIRFTKIAVYKHGYLIDMSSLICTGWWRWWLVSTRHSWSICGAEEKESIWCIRYVYNHWCLGLDMGKRNQEQSSSKMVTGVGSWIGDQSDDKSMLWYPF